MVKRGDLVNANEFVVKVEIRLKLKREDLADSNYFGVRRQVCGFQFAITLLAVKCLPNDKSKLDRPIG